MKHIFSRLISAVLFLLICAHYAWGAENEAHDFSQSISQSLNGCATFSNIVIAEQTYPVKSVIITYAYNKTNSPSATVSIGATEVGTQTFTGTGNLTTTNTLTFTPGAPIKGAVTIVHNSGSSCSGSGKGTLKITNVRLIEGASASCWKEVDVIKGKMEHGTFNLSAGSICGDAPGGSVNITDISPAYGYEFDEITTSASGTVDNVNKRVTNITANTTINVKFKVIPTYTIRFFNNGAQISEESVLSGGTATPPSDPTGCEGYTFVGWWTAELAADNTTEQSWVTDFTVSGNQNYYAVYRHTETSGGGGTPVTKTMSTFTATSGNVESDANVSYAAGQGTAANPPAVNGGEVRIYQNGGTLTITANNGKKISSITIGSSMITSVDYSVDGGADVEDNDISAGGTLLVDGINATTVVFTCTGADKNHRLYLNYLSVTYSDGGGSSTTYYSTDAECGPKVQATASPWVTSTQGQYVKVEVPVTATNFDKNSTLNASVSGTGFSFVGWGANGNFVTKDVDLTTSLILAYCPTAYNTTADATITFSSTYSGSQTPAYTTGTVHGRSLPEQFVIVIKNSDTWYALPANMSGAGTYAGVEVDVDNATSPTKVTAGPATALYSLIGVVNSRYPDYGTRVRFLGNDKCLWSNAASGGTGINNGAVPTNANSDNYEWTLVTTDGVTYAINTNVAKKIEEGRELRYYASEGRFGMYASGNSSFRLLPVDCNSRATVSAVATTYNSITLTWEGKSGTSYNVYIDEGGVTKKTETGVTSPVTISGLSSETNYTWIISPGAKDDDCAYSGDFTTDVAPINVTLSCDGTEYHLGPQDKPYTLPTEGVYVANACTEWTFEGWTATPHSKSTSKPTLIDQVSTDGTVYAVYKNTEAGGGSGSLTLTGAQTTGGGYNTSYSVTEYTSGSDAVTIESNNIINNNTYIQLKAGAGNRVYNTTAMPGDITQITVTATTNSAYVYVGSSAVGSGSTALEPTSGSINSTAVYTIPAGNAYFAVGATGSYVVVSNIEVLYSSSTTYYATTSECCNEVAPPTVVVEPVDVSATISWDDQVGASNGYHVTCSNGTDQDVAAGVTSLEITGLIASTTYTYTVTAKGATCNRSIEGSFTTASCSDVPTNVIVTPGTHTATIRWTASASTATVVIYDDDLGTSIVKTVENQTSPCTITGLNDNTNYYLQVFAGGICPHPIKPFTTQSTAVEVAEWYPNGININLNADEATATVLIEDKQEKAAATGKVADKLFFAKYFEGEGSMKLISIYNGTDHDIPLSGYKINAITRSYNKTKKEWNTSESEYDLSTLGSILKGQEIIFFSRPLSSEPVYSCADTWLTEQAAMNGPEDNPRWIECESGGTYIAKSFTFNGNDALQLIDGSTVIDCFGAADKTVYPSEKNCRNEECWKAKVRNMDYGKDISDFPQEVQDDMDLYGIDLVHDSIEGLATARAILFRDLSVVNGDDAVANNTSTFATFASEWNGRDICGSGTTGLGTCNSFKNLGIFDYNQYYAKFDSVTTVEELSGFKNEDGTYRIPIPQLDTLSCTMLRVKVYEDKVEKASAEYKVPIMVEGSKMTDNEIFKKHEIPTCKECDVVILKNAILEKTSGANDRNEIRNLTIYPGGTLIVPSDKGDYTVQSVQFRVEKETAPVAKLNGNLITKTEQVIVSRRIKNDRFYFFSLPYDCNIADIRWSNGETPVRGVDYEIVEYDGARRALEGSTQGAPGHWTPVSGTQLKAGVGYNIAVASDIFKELVFPMDIGQTNLTNKENTKTAKTVAIHQYTNAGTTINNHNWNLVAHPYVSAFSAYEGDYIKAGKLVYTEPANPGDKGTWHRDEETTNVYLTMPSFNSGGITYTQTVSTDISQLDPFLAVFVQGAGEGDLTFEQSARKLSAPARHLAAKAEDEDESIFAGVILSGNGESDQTNLRIRPDFTDEYQLGYDLEKFITFYTSRPQVYMKTPSYRLAFQAVSDEVAKSTFLPMGVYCYQAGTYTFTLSDRYPIDEIEAVYLFDKQTGVTTNLLYDSYSFTATKQVYTNTRFSLNVIVKRRILESPTGVENLEAPDSMVRKILIDGHVYIQRGKAVYDLTGKSMLNQ